MSSHESRLMKTVLESNDRQFLDQLHRMGTSTVRGICECMGVTATAVRQRLTRLQAVDLVSRELVRTGRGRPHFCYHVSSVGLQCLGDNYLDLAQILWREVKSIEEHDVRNRVVQRVREALVARYGRVVNAESVGERLDQLKSSLVERGFDVETDYSGELPVLRENNCPYQELATLDTSICELEQEVFEEIVGNRMELTQCCLEGNYCCEFQVGKVSASS